MGYRSGNWAYEWTKLGMLHQNRSNDKSGEEVAEGSCSQRLYVSALRVTTHLKNDNLAAQAQVLSKLLKRFSIPSWLLSDWKFPYQNKKIKANLHLAKTDKPVVVIVSALEVWKVLQADMAFARGLSGAKHSRCFTVDMPSIGHNSHWPLTEVQHCLHQAVLNELPNIPWVDHHKVGVLVWFETNAMVELSLSSNRKDQSVYLSWCANSRYFYCMPIN